MNYKKPSFFPLIVMVLLMVSSLQAKTWTAFNKDSASGSEVSCQLLSDTSGKIVLDMKIPGMFENIVEKDGVHYKKLSVPGAALLTESGKPELPSIVKVFEIPAGAKVSARITETTRQILPGYLIVPFQVTYDSDDTSKWQIDNALYSGNSVYPSQEIEISQQLEIRGHSLVNIRVNPIRWNPGTGELMVTTAFKLIITYPQIDAAPIKSNKISPLFENLVRNSAVNKCPTSICEYTTKMDTDPGAEYLIITHDDFYDPANPQSSQVYRLAQQKIAKGLSVKIVRLSDIGVAPTLAEMQTYIRQAYENWEQAPVYLLLVGDCEQIPAWNSSSTPTDLYFGTMDGSSDYIPDILVGRFSAKNLDELTVLVQKTINYENDTFTAEWKNRVLTAAYFEDDDDDGRGDRGYLETAESVRAYMSNQGYDSRSIYTTHSTNPTTYFNGQPIPSTLQFTEPRAATQKIVDIFNEGIVLGAHRDHGSYSGWWEPSLTKNDISSFNNIDKLPLLFGINCYSGYYGEDDAFGEQMVKYANGGAIGYIGATVASPTYDNHTFYQGLFDCLFPDYLPEFSPPSSGSKKMGAIMLYGKMYCASTMYYQKSMFEMYNLLGDPELDIQIASKANSYTIAASAHENGSISPAGNVVINEGDAITFTITPDAGYIVYRVYVNGGNMGSIESYTFENVSRDCEIVAYFVKDPNLTKGDIDGDGEIASTDYAMLHRYLLGTVTLTDDQKIAADVDGDGVVSSIDYACFKRYLLGIITEFPEN